MQALRWAVATRCWKLPLTQTLLSVTDMNVTGVQLDLREELPPTALTETGRRDFLHRLREYGLQVASGWVPLRHPLYSPIELERRMAFLRDAMKFAWQLQARVLCLRVGRIPDELDTGDGALLVELLSDLTAYGNHVGVTLALTPTTESAEQLGNLIPRIKTGLIGIDFDPAHFAMQGLSACDALRQLHAHIGHFQLRDGVRELTGGGSETAVGEGVLDWAELMALLGEIDYRGWVTAIRNHGDDRPGDIARGLQRVQRLILGG